MAPRATSTIDLPRFAPARAIRASIAHLSPATLRNWHTAGWVRSLKLGGSKQAGRLFNVEDVLACLDRLASGHSPRQRWRPPQSAGGSDSPRLP